ncbi:hypothetical protein CVD25_22600 [Bacillus canaveralius]|uniref:Uncharacterized protein n=1 Tax=Bacillus canaveralius TaxID=1403243 RepID=A0A2N5GGN7_9BACI|nr:MULTISPECIES: hypothetical protein [Bacillus]PLR79924.1 hypothetical protein CU635_20430 [Bacillus canaveralius]PLR83514.1 hypothetical protein CVD23_14245 [Bacillus sp. V33-4]PLR88433.1 hypothetical protein CVD25_22600 [Bacillus canaveralius]RSK58177.1 hypothetical protein EJA13_00185 [Bacillus canaveralius]
MLLLISTLLVIVYTIVCVIKVHTHKDKLVNMTGMTVAMVLGMASSLTMGLIAGIEFQGNLSLSTIIAIHYSLMVGILVGRPINLLTLVEGMAAGVMGGMMGAMLGEMLPSGDFTLMLVLTDILFMVSVVSIIFLINAELKKTGEPVSFYPRTFPWIVTSVISAVIILTLATLETKPMLSDSNVQEEQHHHHE